MLKRLKTLLPIISFYFASIYLVSLLFGNDLHGYRFFQKALLGAIILFEMKSINLISKQFLYSKINPILFFTIAFFIVSISICFNCIDYKVFLFEIGNISGLGAFISGVILTFLKDDNSKAKTLVFQSQFYFYTAFLIVFPAVAYVLLYNIRHTLSYSFYSVISTSILLGISMLVWLGWCKLNPIKNVRIIKRDKHPGK